MRQKRHNTDDIIRLLHEADGNSVETLCRQHTSSQIFTDGGRNSVG